MSAYVVEDTRIIALSAYVAILDDSMSRHLSDTRERATTMAKMLHSENIRSVNARYQETFSPCLREVTTEDIARAGMDPIEALKLCACIEYQSCETEKYEDSDAYKCLHTMRKTIIRALPGYAEANWG